MTLKLDFSENEILSLSETTIANLYKSVTWNLIKQLAAALKANKFPVGKKIPYDGPTVSKVHNPCFWLREDNDGLSHSSLDSNLATPTHLYVNDLINPEFIINVQKCINAAINRNKEYKEVEEWINSGNRCVYRYGFAYRGAGARDITKEKALELLPNYSFGTGFYSLSWITINGEKVLEFNELSENDMW